MGEEDQVSMIMGDPTKMRVQVTYDTTTSKVGIKLTDQGTGHAMMAEIDPTLAMQVGDKLFKLGADMRANAAGNQQLP